MAVIYTRKATIDDLDKIMSIVEDARELFKNDKIPQWQGSYPDEERFKEDKIITRINQNTDPQHGCWCY